MGLLIYNESCLGVVGMWEWYEDVGRVAGEVHRGCFNFCTLWVGLSGLGV